jgi:type VI secretion system protein ImpH
MIQRTERERKDSERRALRDWFDLINHRFISLFFRAWEKYRFFVPYSRRTSRRGEPDPFTNVLLSLTGVGQATLRDRLRVVAVWPRPNGPPREQVLTRVETLALAYYSGLLAQRPRNALGLEAVLQDFFRLPIRVLQFQGEWLRLEPSKQSAVGDRRLGKLSLTAVVGDRVWDVQGKIRLRIGPLTYAQYLSLLPDRWPFPERKQFFEAQLILRREEIPECQLPEEAEEGPQLGRNAWLLSETPDRDAEDAVFEGEELVHLSPVVEETS